MKIANNETKLFPVLDELEAAIRKALVSNRIPGMKVLAKGDIVRANTVPPDTGPALKAVPHYL